MIVHQVEHRTGADSMFDELKHKRLETLEGKLKAKEKENKQLQHELDQLSIAAAGTPL